MGRLDGKVAVITGTGGGQGREAALRFTAEGAKVVGCDLNGETGEETLRLVHEAGGEMVSVHPMDLQEEQNAHDLLELAATTYGGVDILYNNAMTNIGGYPEEYPLDAWEATMRQVLTMHFLCAKHAIPHFRKRGGGAMVHISSAAGGPVGTALPGNEPFPFCYAAAKIGLERLSMSIAIEYGPIGIRSNAIAPGPVRTPLSAGIFEKPGDLIYEPQIEQLLTDFIGAADDIVDAALFLASDESSYITGTVLRVDGGMMASGGGGRPDPRLSMDANGFAEAIHREPYWPTSGSRA